MKRFAKKQSDSPPRRRQPTTQIEQPELSLSAAFRRNKTLTGSSSSQVRSAGEKQAQLQSHRTKAHHLVDLRRRLSVILAGVLLVVFALYLLVSQFTAQVRISITGQPQSQTASYVSIIQDYLAKHPIERLRFLLNEHGLTDYVQAAAPEIKTLSIEPASEFASSLVVMTARQPIASWQIGDTQEYVDSSGVAFQKNYFSEPEVTIVDKSGIPVASGEAIASNRFLGFVGMLTGNLQDRHYVVKQITIPSGTTRQVQVKLKGIPYYIKCSIDRSAGEQAEDIDRVIRYLKTRHHTAEYLDVRVEGKAYYK